MASIKITNLVDTRKKLDWQQTLQDLIDLTAMPGAVSETKQIQHLNVFIDAIANTIKNKIAHTKDNSCYAIPREYINTFFKNAFGTQKISDRFIKNCEKLLLIKDDDYSFGAIEASCKRTIGFHPLLLNAIKLKYAVQKNEINWKYEFLKNNENIKIVTNLSTDTLEINFNNQLVSKQITQLDNIVDNEYFCVIQKIQLDEMKNLKSVAKLIQSLKNKYNSLKTSALKQGRLIYLSMIENYIDELKNNNGYYIDFYQKKDCNRFFGMGVTMQCIKKVILEKLLKGQAIEIDQKSAHINIISEFANSFNMNIPQIIKEYLNDTSLFIKNSMKNGKMRKRTVKTAILSAANGCLTWSSNRCDQLKELCNEIYNLSQKLLKLGITYKEICNEEAKRSEQILIKSNNLMNLIRWAHDGVMILNDGSQELNLQLNFKTTNQTL